MYAETYKERFQGSEGRPGPLRELIPYGARQYVGTAEEPPTTDSAGAGDVKNKGCGEPGIA
jgi:hypothetical protein